MRRILLILLLTFVLIIARASALSYEDKPNVTAYIVGSNHLNRGEQIINIVVYNSAERKKVDYFDQKEAMFFSNNENMLFTAYNVQIQLEGNNYFDVKTSTQKIPALPPMKPIKLPFVVEVKDSAKAGEYELKLKVKYDIIDSLVDLETFYPASQSWSPYQKVVSGTNTSVVYEYHPLTRYYKLRYKQIEYEIPIKVYVEEKKVKLKITEVKADDLFGKGKGKIEVTVKNIGEKTARDAYLVLETPTGFKASALSLQTTAAMSSMSVMPSFARTMMPVPMATTSKQIQSPSTPAYFIGDLKPNESAKAIFYVKINTEDAGNYTFKIKAVYLDEYGNTVESDAVPFGVYVKAAPTIIVKDVKSKVYVNSKGDVIVKFTPTADLKDVSLILSTNLPLSVLSSEYYIGDVKANETYTAVFKVQASDEAKPLTYPANIRMKYKSLDEFFTSDPVEIGIKVNPKIKFEVYGEPKIEAGKEKIVEWEIKNAGNFTVREATARLTIVDPFSSTDDTAYIGTLKPNETAVIKFKLKVDSDATPKKYGLNLEVKFKDLEGEWAISEPVKAVIVVEKARFPYAMTAIAVIALIIIAAIALRRRSK